MGNEKPILPREGIETAVIRDARMSTINSFSILP
jgi:hypothetical protein